MNINFSDLLYISLDALVFGAMLGILWRIADWLFCERASVPSKKFFVLGTICIMAFVFFRVYTTGELQKAGLNITTLQTGIFLIIYSIPFGFGWYAGRTLWTKK